LSGTCALAGRTMLNSRLAVMMHRFMASFLVRLCETPV
jgi:hypothetical protein